MRGSNASKILWTVALVGALCLPAAEATAQPVAEVSLGAGGIAWSPAVEYERLVLTVSGAGRHFRQEFAAGEAVSFGILTEEGLLSDGQYKWELLVVPSARDREPGADPLPRQVQSGYFRIAGGALVGPGLEEAVAASAGPKADGGGGFTEDQVILDDLIVNGSACIGQDCVNGESFGFDTLRLKENNLRIRFFDTSSSASFPTNDWQITANDSSNGGANKFSIDDIDGGRTPFTIEAGAPSNSLFVDDGGRIGFGTSTPVVELHVVDGNTPTLRLEQDGSSGFTPQTWDVAGNEAGFFVRDATNGSTLPFRIRPGAASQALVIEGTTSDIGIGAGLNPAASLHVRRTNGTAQLLVEEASSTTANRVLFALQNNGPANFQFQNTNIAANLAWTMGVLGTGNFAINAAGVGAGNDFVIATNGDIEAPQGTVVHTSSRTMKTGIEPVNGREVLEKLAAMPVATWRYDRGSNEEEALHLGPMAEDFYATFGLGTSERSIALSDSAGVALAAIQGLNQVVEEKDARIAELETRLAKLEAALAAFSADSE